MCEMSLPAKSRDLSIFHMSRSLSVAAALVRRASGSKVMRQTSITKKRSPASSREFQLGAKSFKLFSVSFTSLSAKTTPASSSEPYLDYYTLRHSNEKPQIHILALPIKFVPSINISNSSLQRSRESYGTPSEAFESYLWSRLQTRNASARSEETAKERE